MSDDEREDSLAELRPLDERNRSAREDTSELEEVEHEQRPSCFDVNRFLGIGGCMICASSEDPNAVLVQRIRRLQNTWDGNGWCRPERNGKLDDVVEEVEEATSLADDDESSAIDDTITVASYSAASPAKDALWFEIEAVRMGSASLFESKGWEIVPKGGERYSLNGRGIKLRLVPAGAMPPHFQHLLGYVSYEVAERATRITVCDGPLRQPLLDYLLQTGQNESYDQRGTENIAGVSGAAKLLDFNVAPTGDRIYAMKSAMIQADLRRLADGFPEAARVSALQRDGAKLQGGSGPMGPGGRSPTKLER